MQQSNGYVSNGSPTRACRLPALRRFAAAITVLNVLGHTVLGFEQSWAQPLVALATAYFLELLLEVVAAWSERRPRQFVGGLGRFIDFLLPAHISGLAVSMLLYANDRLGPIAFAAAVAIGSKVLVRVPVGHSFRHCLNPSNTGIAVTLLVFPWVGIAPPYQFTENLYGVGDWLLPMVIIASGTFLNTRFTGKMPLIVGWLGGFVIQAVLRSELFGTPVVAALMPLTGMAFLLFTFYMVTDPATTPGSPWAQFAFGVAVAAAYAALMLGHVVFGLFFALLLISSLRGLGLTAYAALASVQARAASSRALLTTVSVPTPAGSLAELELANR
jgi:enediyne biosynthesis protein E5